MALTTPTSDLRIVNYFGRSMRVFYGQLLPEHVRHIETIRCAITYELKVRWTTVDGPTIHRHEMPFEQTDEGVTAAIVAMKLTC